MAESCPITASRSSVEYEVLREVLRGLPRQAAGECAGIPRGGCLAVALNWAFGPYSLGVHGDQDLFAWDFVFDLE